ncbi:hypothetical protein HNO89_003839 [Sporosarcina luteola]|nr:hypothetical protein [Sporosarcina luteola]
MLACTPLCAGEGGLCAGTADVCAAALRLCVGTTTLCAPGLLLEIHSLRGEYNRWLAYSFAQNALDHSRFCYKVTLNHPMPLVKMWLYARVEVVYARFQDFARASVRSPAV